MNVVLFDGVCNLCHSTVSFIRKRDRKALLRFVALQSEAGKTLLKAYAVGRENDTLYYLRGDVCFQRSAAVLHLLKDLGGGWKCFYPLILLPSCIRDGVYLFVSRNRYRWFGKRNDCRLT